MSIPKKIKRQALLSALTAAASEGRIKIIEDLSLEAPKTKVIAEIFDKIGLAGSKVLFLTEGKDDSMQKSCRNLSGLVQKRACLVNPYDLLICDFVLITSKALDSLTEAFAR